jgi:3-dehydroquinate dehydratase II
LKKILCLSGPNLQLLGSRQPEVYGAETLREIHARLKTRGAELGVEVTCKQSNHEGVLCDAIGSAAKSHTGILLNAAAYTHTSIALLDALLAVRLPCVEVHLSNPLRREPMRHKSYIARAAIAATAICLRLRASCAISSVTRVRIPKLLGLVYRTALSKERRNISAPERMSMICRRLA